MGRIGCSRSVSSVGKSTGDLPLLWVYTAARSGELRPRPLRGKGKGKKGETRVEMASAHPVGFARPRRAARFRLRRRYLAFTNSAVAASADGLHQMAGLRRQGGVSQSVGRKSPSGRARGRRSDRAPRGADAALVRPKGPPVEPEFRQ